MLHHLLSAENGRCEEFKDLLGDSNENVHKMCFSEGFKILLIWLPLNWSPLKEERTSSANNKLIISYSNMWIVAKLKR